MALKKPIVQFNLKEGRASAQEASLYADNDSIEDFAQKILELLNDPDKRNRMGEFGYKRVLNELNWEHERKNLVSIYSKVLSAN